MPSATRPPESPNDGIEEQASFAPSYLDDFDQLRQPYEIIGIPGEERQSLRDRHGRDHQVGKAPSGLPPGRQNSRIYPAVRSRRLHPERHRIKRCFGTLKTILPTGSLRGVIRRRWPSGQLGKCDGRNTHPDG